MFKKWFSFFYLQISIQLNFFPKVNLKYIKKAFIFLFKQLFPFEFESN